MKIVALTLAAAAMLVAAPAFAHPKLVTSTPANGAAVGKTSTVTLNFTEKLVPTFSGATLAMTGMGGKAHAPMAIATAKPTFAKDGKSMTLTAKSPLVPGDYKVDWHVVGADTHRITGSVAFTVR